MSWKDINEGGTSGNILSLQAGEKATIHVIGEPKSYWEHFFPSMQRSLICPHRGCPACNNDETKARLRHSFIVYDLGDKSIKTWTVSNTVALSIKNIWESYNGDLSGVDLEIKRTGTGLSTKYAVVPVKTKYDDSMIEGEDLPDLDSIFTPATEEEIKSMLESELGDEAGFEEKEEKKPAAKKSTAKKAVKAEAVGSEDPKPQKESHTPQETKKPETSTDRMTILRRCLPKFGKLDGDSKKTILSAFGKANLAQLTAEELLQAEEMM